MSDPLHLQPDPGPDTRQVRLGDQIFEVPADAAQAFEQQLETLAAQYGAALEQQHAQVMQSIGTPRGPVGPTPPEVPEGLAVPDPDLLFNNKGAWTEQFGNSLQQQLGLQQMQTTNQIAGLANAFQQELQRRDQMQAAKSAHDAAMNAMLERHGLEEHTRIVQAVYNELYPKLQHLPLEMGLERIGQEAENEIARIRSGEKWTVTPGGNQSGVTQRPPAMLRSARRATRAPAPAPAPQETQLQEPGGGLGMMGQIIRKRQEQVLGRSTA